MLRRSLADGAGHFWQPAEFKNVANPDFENLKHFQNPGHLLLTKPSTLCYIFKITNWQVNLLSKTHDNMEIGNKSDYDSTMQPLISEEELNAI